MARNAGFAFCASFTETMVNGALRAYHANFVPPFAFSLPDSVTVAGVPFGFAGSLILLAPQVTLRTNDADLVTAWLGFAGPVTLSGGPLPGPYQVLLATTVELGLVSTVTPAGPQQTIVAGLDVAQASVTALDVSVYTGPPLDQSYTAALNSPDVLSALTTALRAIPPALLQVTPTGFSLPLTKSVAYQPPNHPPVDNPRTLFDMTLRITRLVTRPINSATGNSGALAIGIDLSDPNTSGNAAALVDLNTMVAPVGYALDPVEDGLQRGSVQDPTQPHNSDFALAANADVIIGLVNIYVAPQISGAFVQSHVAFSKPILNGAGQPNTYDTLSVGFGTFTPPLSPLTLTGLLLTAHLVYYTDVQRYPDGYPVETDDIDVDLTVTLGLTLDLHRSGLQVIRPAPTPVGPDTLNVTFSTDPPGSYFYLNGGLVELGLGPASSVVLPLTEGIHTVTAPISGFGAWTATDPLSFDNPYPPTPPLVYTMTVPSGILEVWNGDGAVQLQTSAWNPLLSADQWSLTIQMWSVALPVWADIALLLAGPVLVGISMVTSLIGRMGFWVPDLVFNMSTNAIPMVQTGINDEISDLPLVGQSMSIMQLPGTAAPDFVLTASDIVLSDEGFEAYSNLLLSTPTRTFGYAGSVPYLLITDQPISDPGEVTVTSPFDGAFPQRVDGTLTLPLAPGAQIATPSLSWDVHASGPIVAVLKLPDGLFNPQDPSVQVTWTLRSATTGAVLQTTTGAAYPLTGAVTPWLFSIDHASNALQAESGFALRLTLSQPIGGGSTIKVFSAALDITIADHFDRHHPFVQWGPTERIFSPGIPYWNATGAVLKKRYVRQVGLSRIHRTDVGPGKRRCVVADTSGRGFHLANKLRNSGLPPDKNDVARPLNYPWRYLDTLPLTAAQIAANRDAARGVLCDYCFFGGPDKTQLRSDFPVPIP